MKFFMGQGTGQAGGQPLNNGQASDIPHGERGEADPSWNIQEERCHEDTAPNPQQAGKKSNEQPEATCQEL